MNGLTRRLLIGVALPRIALAGASLLGGCQPPRLPATEPSRKVARLGFLALTSADDYAPYIAAFRSGLSDLGYVDGETLEIETRFAQGHDELLPALADDLVQRHVDVLVTASTQASRAAQQATS